MNIHPTHLLRREPHALVLICALSACVDGKSDADAPSPPSRLAQPESRANRSARSFTQPLQAQAVAPERPPVAMQDNGAARPLAQEPPSDKAVEQALGMLSTDGSAVSGVGLRGAGAGGGGTGGLSLLGSGRVGTRGRGSGDVGYLAGGGGLGGVTRDRSPTPSLPSVVGAFAMPPALPSPASPAPYGGTFVHAGTNPVVTTQTDPLSTFAVDVDTGSFTYGQRFLRMQATPEPASVRVEEWVNGLHYDYPAPEDGRAFAVHVAAAPSPFTHGHHAVRIALQGRRVSNEERKPTHLTFLVDVSGSMQSPDKLPLAKEAMRTALRSLRDDDSVAVVTYAGRTSVVLPATPVRQRDTIEQAILSLQSGGGTAMASGMELAYREATKQLGSDRTARVMVLSDGDANIGPVGHLDILKSIRGYVSEGVTLSTVGFGTGNYNDHLMEQLADAGNGNYSYIDSRATMQRVFDDELTSALEVIAQDVKIQVEWNPKAVRSYRLLGFENRDVADVDFRNDKKDAGEIGAGHAVTALYEVQLTPSAMTNDLGVVRVRHKKPRGTTAAELAVPMASALARSTQENLDSDGLAALGTALAAEVLRGSPYAKDLTLGDAARLLHASAHGEHAPERRELAARLERVAAATVAQR